LEVNYAKLLEMNSFFTLHSFIEVGKTQDLSSQIIGQFYIAPVQDLLEGAECTPFQRLLYHHHTRPVTTHQTGN
jgi:hypothetical protein